MNKKRGIELAISLLSSILYVTIYSFSTSPLYFVSGNDSSVYILLGKFLKDGLTMYTDFFEHKGPIIFFIESVGSHISEGRTGAFVVQIFFMTFTIWGIYRLTKLFCSTKKSIVVTVISLLTLSSYYEGGNLTEEFCLPVIIICLYLMTKFLKSENEETYNYKFAILYGGSFAYCAFIRLTNALPICVFILLVLIILIRKRKWGEILKSGMAFILGMAIIIIPIMIYCYYHNIVKEMIDCSFVYNFKYVTSNQEGLGVNEFKDILYLIPLLMVIVVGIESLIRKKYIYISSALILSGIVGTVLQLKGYYFLHYLIMWIPAFTITVALFFARENNKGFLRKAYNIIMLLGLMWIIVKNIYVGKDVVNAVNSDILKAYDREAKEIVRNIPEKNKNRVLAYNTNIYFYMSTKIDPCYKYYANQDWLGHFDKQASVEFSKKLKNGSIKYLVIEKDIEKKDDVEKHYKLIKKTKNIKLYKYSQ